MANRVAPIKIEISPSRPESSTGAATEEEEQPQQKAGRRSFDLVRKLSEGHETVKAKLEKARVAVSKDRVSNKCLHDA